MKDFRHDRHQICFIIIRRQNKVGERGLTGISESLINLELEEMFVLILILNLARYLIFLDDDIWALTIIR